MIYSISYTDSKNVNFDFYLAVWVKSKLDGRHECGRSRLETLEPNLTKIHSERTVKVGGPKLRK